MDPGRRRGFGEGFSQSQQTPSGASSQSAEIAPNAQLAQSAQFPPNAQFAPNGQFAPNAQFAPNGQIAPNAQFAPNGQFPPNAQFAPSAPGQPTSPGQSTGSVRAYFGLNGSGLAKDEAESDGSLQTVFRIALEDSLAVTCLYAIVVCGRGLTTPGVMSVFSDKSFWLWLALLIICNIFLQVFYPPLRQQLVQASVFSVVLVLMSPIKTPALCP